VLLLPLVCDACYLLSSSMHLLAQSLQRCLLLLFCLPDSRKGGNNKNRALLLLLLRLLLLAPNSSSAHTQFFQGALVLGC
jgi:hypothetical protein